MEIHHRGLSEFEVNESTYSSIVIPSVFEKIPEVLRLSITRQKDYAKWSLQSKLNCLSEKIELGEDQRSVIQTNERKRYHEGKRRAEKGSTASALATFAQGNVVKCSFCLDLQKHEDCIKVTST